MVAWALRFMSTLWRLTPSFRCRFRQCTGQAIGINPDACCPALTGPPRRGAQIRDGAGAGDDDLSDYPLPRRIASIPNLRVAWYSSPDSDFVGRAPGVDGVRARSYGRQLETNLQILRSKLLNRYFQFKPLRAVDFPKSDGNGFRIICIPTVEDRLVQRLLCNYLNDGDKLGALNSVSYGFIEKRGVKKAVARARNLRNSKPWVFKSDISSFFDRINRNFLVENLARKMRGSSILPLLISAINLEIGQADPDTQRAISRAGIRHGVGLRQGMPIAPLLSNFVLKRFDRRFEAKKVSLVRYADDFVVFCNNRQECDNAYDLARETLAELEHIIPDIGPGSKTQIFSPDEAAGFLGYELQKSGTRRYNLTIPRTACLSLDEKLGRFCDLEYCLMKYRTLARATSSLENTVTGYIRAYSLAANQAVFEQHALAKREQVMSRMFAGLFGAQALERLTEPKKRFLGILRDREFRDEGTGDTST